MLLTMSPIRPGASSGRLRLARRIALASVALAGLLTLAFAGESASARGFGGMHSFGGARSFGGMRAVNTRTMRVSSVRTSRVVTRDPGRIGRVRGGDNRYPGKISRYPGNGDRNPGKVGSHDPGRWPPYRPGRPGRPIWHPPGYPVVTPFVPLLPGPGTISTTSVPPTVNQATSPPNGQGPGQTSQGGQGGSFNPPPPGETRYVRNEALLNVAANVSTPVFDAMLRRNRLTRLELLDFAMTGRRIARVRINDGREVAQVIQSLRGQSLRGEVGITGAQPNYLFALDQGQGQVQGPANDPTQYAYAKLNLSPAHALVRGSSIRVAVIDSMIDTTHPDLAGAVAASFDATGAPRPHFHGTGVAGVIAAHGKLTGAAPSVQILAATAFGRIDSRGTGMDILKALDWAGTSKADIVNMSFTGPDDPEQHIQLVALHRRGAVLIAAAGNGGPTSPALYPAADPEVIAVTATDSDDNLYAQANRGAYIAVAAPGVSILVASPGGSYALRSGTSFAAPQVSGVAALLLERNRKLDPLAVRSILTATARDLGPPGRDDQFGAGLVNAMSAVESAGMQSSEVSARDARPGN